MKNKIILILSIILCVTIAALVWVVINNSDNQIQYIYNNDPSQYIEKHQDPDNKIAEVIKSKYIQYNNNEVMEDEKKVTGIIELYSIAKWENYEDINFDFDFYMFFSDVIEDRTNIDYQISKWELISMRREQLGVNILWSDFNITIEDITIKDGVITINVNEQHSYITEDMNSDISSAIYKETFTFIKEKDCWKISNIYSNDEFDKEYFNDIIHVQEWLDRINKSIDLEPKTGE